MTVNSGNGHPLREPARSLNADDLPAPADVAHAPAAQIAGPARHQRVDGHVLAGVGTHSGDLVSHTSGGMRNGFGEAKPSSSEPQMPTA